MLLVCHVLLTWQHAAILEAAQHLLCIRFVCMSTYVAVRNAHLWYRQFPRVGAYWACGLKGSGERVEAILAADSLMPPGNGRPLSHQDRLPTAPVTPHTYHQVCLQHH